MINWESVTPYSTLPIIPHRVNMGMGQILRPRFFKVTFSCLFNHQFEVTLAQKGSLNHLKGVEKNW